jgi:hypothetical protein
MWGFIPRPSVDKLSPTPFHPGALGDAVTVAHAPLGPRPLLAMASLPSTPFTIDRLQTTTPSAHARPYHHVIFLAIMSSHSAATAGTINPNSKKGRSEIGPSTVCS